MATFLQRVKSITSVIDERIERERKANELKKLCEKFVLVNEELTNIIWACRFVLGISEDSELQSLFNITRDRYESLRESLISLWGENPDKIDILEPTELYEPLDEIMRMCQQSEIKMNEILRQNMEKIKATHVLAESLSIIPDIRIDFQIFMEAKSFLSKAGSSAASVAEHVERDKKLCEKKIKEWHSLSAKLSKEQAKLDLQNVKGKKLTSETLSFLTQFVKNNGEADFESINGEVVDELKSKFPELCKKLRVSMS